MARGAHSKIERRNKRVKRQLILQEVVSPRLRRQQENMLKVDTATYEAPLRPKNAFLYPDDPSAEIPQVDVSAKLDFRSEALPASALMGRHNRRNYTEEEKEQLGLPMTDRDLDRALVDSRQREQAAIIGVNAMEMEDDDSEMQGNTRYGEKLDLERRIKAREMEILAKMRKDRHENRLSFRTRRKGK